MNSKSSMNQYRYVVLDYHEQFENGVCFKSTLDEGEVECLAKAAAEHFDSDCFWSSDSEEGELLFEVFKEDGLSLGVFEVHKRLIASFSIYPKNKSID